MLQGGTLDEALSCTDVNGDELAYDCAVGASHWESVFRDPGEMPGPAPEMYPSWGRQR